MKRKKNKNTKIIYFILIAFVLFLFIQIINKLISTKISYKPSASEFIPSNSRSNIYIIGGTPVIDPKKWPFTVMLFDIYNPKIFEPLTYSFCSGSLIAPNWVLTAAHCITERPKNTSGLGVVAGLTDVKSWKNKDIYVAKRYIVHKNFNPQTLENDIALIELRSSVRSLKSIKTVSLNNDVRMEKAKNSSDQNQFGVILGYGLKEENGQKVNTLNQGIIPIRTEKAAKTYNIKESQIPAGYVYGGVCPFLMDSGGPFVAWNGEKWVQIGINSWGFGSCSKGMSMQLFTRVSSYIDWIKEKTTQNICNVSCHKNFVGPNRGLFVGQYLTEQELKEFNCRWNNEGINFIDTFRNCLRAKP